MVEVRGQDGDNSHLLTLKILIFYSDIFTKSKKSLSFPNQVIAFLPSESPRFKAIARPSHQSSKTTFPVEAGNKENQP